MIRQKKMTQLLFFLFVRSVCDGEKPSPPLRPPTAAPPPQVSEGESRQTREKKKEETNVKNAKQSKTNKQKSESLIVFSKI
jgi:hypothetical protein